MKDLAAFIVVVSWWWAHPVVSLFLVVYFLL